MKAILLGNRKRERLTERVEALRPRFRNALDVVAEDYDCQLDLTTVAADIAVVFGGDGSILRAVHQMGENQIPILAVNLGTLGFLSSVYPEELEPFLNSDAFKKFSTREQLLLNCSVWSRSEDDEPASDEKPGVPRLYSRALPSNLGEGVADRCCKSNHLVVNEAVIRAGAPFSIIKIAFAIDGERVTTFRGDGLILATPVGSTGHSLSVGGPILRNDLDSIVATPIAPQTMTFRPVVDSASRVYEMQALSGEAHLVIDGETRRRLSPDDLVVLRRAPFKFKMIVVPENKYYRNLQRKLDWAVDNIAIGNDGLR